MKALQLFVVPGLPAFQPGDDVAAQIVEQLAAMEEGLLPGDIVVVAQKIVSKAEGRLVRLIDVEPGEQALKQRLDRARACVAGRTLKRGQRLACFVLE